VRSFGGYERSDWIVSPDTEIVRRVQAKCADLHEQGGNWTTEDGIEIGKMFNESADPFSLFRFVDERTGDPAVGYRTKDGREWFHILRQMRNQPGSGLLETMRGMFDGHSASGDPLPTEGATTT